MNRIAIIPARGGSRRIPGKNRRMFHGKPIIRYSLDCARLSKLFDDIIVSTDDDCIADIARSACVTVHHRAPEFARDEVGTQAVAQSVLNDLFPPPGDLPLYTCVIYPCAPLLDPADLEAAWKAVIDGHRYAIGVGAEPLRDAGAFYFGKSWAFMSGEPLIGPHTAMIALPESRVCDVNTEADWIRAEKLYEELPR